MSHHRLIGEKDTEDQRQCSADKREDGGGKFNGLGDDHFEQIKKQRDQSQGDREQSHPQDLGLVPGLTFDHFNLLYLNGRNIFPFGDNVRPYKSPPQNQGQI
jgi:hypothetical protein